MSHSLSKVWIHAIFGTKDKQPLIDKDNSFPIHRRVAEQFEKIGCQVQIINGISDHVHVLFLMPIDKSIAEIMKAVKGGSSHWLNRQEFMKTKFAWQIGYGAFSVSESQVEVVEEYIKNQVEHHRKRTYQEEIDLFLKNYGLG